MINIGIAGLGRKGMHHLERLSLRDDLRVVAVHDAARDRIATSKHLCGRFHSTTQDLLADREIEVVLVATPPHTRVPLVREALAAGKHVAVESPLGFSHLDVTGIVNLAARAGRYVAILPANRFDPDFPTVLGTVRSGALGRVYAAKRVVWGSRAAVESHERPPDENDLSNFPRVLVEPATACLEQVLALVSDPVVCVHATSSSSLLTAASFQDARAIAIRLGFLNGATAEIDIDDDSLVPLRTGWVISGSEGGYKKLRRYHRTREQEIFDIPVEPIERASDAIYDNLVKRLRGESPDEFFSTDGWQVVRLLEAARKSAEKRETVTLDAVVVTTSPNVWTA